MLTQIPSDKYWFDKRAVSISLNALDNPDTIQVYVSGNAVVMACMEGIDGLDYDVSHNYRRWKLTGSPTYFPTHTEKYVYIAIPRAMTSDGSPTGTAMVVFPSEMVDLYGKNEAGVQVYPDRFFYLFTNGIITSSGEDGKTRRDWKRDHDIISGTLHTDYGNDRPADAEWYEYISATSLVKFLKDITMEAGTKFRKLFAQTITLVSGGSIRFGESETAPTITGVADLGEAPGSGTPLTSPSHIVTPKYLDASALSKLHNDKTDFGLEMASLRVNGKTDHFGNTTFGIFSKGIVGGTGAQIDRNGNAELESLIVRNALTVPALHYNRVEVHSGVEWYTKGSGIIDSVEQTDATHGIIHLRLEEGEYGTLAINDYCKGIFHNLDGNATDTTDDRHGNMEFAGFTTVCFRITDVSGKYQDTLAYELRPLSADWSSQVHPQPQMTFVAYANPVAEDRRTAILKTTEYTVYLQDMTTWDFGPDNYYLILGNLEGFSVWATNAKGTRYLKQLSGNGAMLGNVYMYGDINQFDRLADHIDITVDPRKNSDLTLNEGEALTLTLQMLSWDELPRPDATYHITRHSDNAAADQDWNARRGTLPSNTILITPADLGGYRSVQFTIHATRSIVSQGGDEDYTVTRDIVLRLAAKDGAKGDKGDPGTGIDIKGSSVKFFPTQSEYTKAEKTAGTYLVGTTSVFTPGQGAQTHYGAYVYTYDASGKTTIADADENDIYISQDNGHLYVSTLRDETPAVIGNGLKWYDSGEIRGQNAVQYTLSVPASIMEGTTTFPLTVIKTDGTFSSPISYDQATTEGVAVIGEAVEWNAQNQRFHLPAGAAKGTTYTITLMLNGYVIQTYTIPCIGNGEQGEQGEAAISISVEGENLVFPHNGTLQRVYVDVYRGNKKLDYRAGDFLCSTLSSDGYVLNGKVSWSPATIGGRFMYQLRVRSEYKGTNVSGTVPFTVTVDGNEYKRNINVRTVLNGEDGYNGCVIRRSEWLPGKTYRNDSDHNSVDPITGQYIIDEVTISSWNGGNGKRFLCQHTHTSEATDLDNATETLSHIDDETQLQCWATLQAINPVSTPFADINQAFIQYLQANQILITDPTTGQPYGAFGAAVGENHYPLWFGGEDWQHAIVRFDKNGNVQFGPYFTVKDGNVSMQGNIKATGGTFLGKVAFGGEQNTNIAFLPDHDSQGAAIVVYQGPDEQMHVGNGKNEDGFDTCGIFFPNALFTNTGMLVTAQNGYDTLRAFVGRRTTITGKAYPLFRLGHSDTLKGQCEITYNDNGTLRVLMQNLPTTKPTEKNLLYNDNGTLKIS